MMSCITIQPDKFPEKPFVISINNINYYDAKDLYNYDKVYFYGCSKSVRLILTKKEIPTEMFEYASNSVKNGWGFYNKQNKISNKAKLLLNEEWVINNVPKMASENVIEEVKYDIEEAPPLLELRDEEKFKDDEGNILEIEVYGDRNYTNCYFKAKSISDGFNMPNLNDTILRKEQKYIRNIHYKTFITTELINNQLLTNKKTLFITYKGILKILFSSRSGNADKFIDWATETLFTVQMGTEESKVSLVRELGVNTDDMKRCLQVSTQKMSCVYLLGLGLVKDLRSEFDIKKTIKDTYIVCKFGRGNDLNRRLSEHELDYGKIVGVSISVIKYAYIDPEFLNEAELCVSHMFNITENKLRVDKRKELIFIKQSNLKFVKEYFESLQKRFVGQYKEQVHEIEKKNLIIGNKEKEITDLKIIHQKDIELKNKDIENRDLIIENKNLIIENRNLIIESKNREIKNIQ
jgi:hypothetical protein